MAFNPTKLPIDDVLPRIRAAISAGRDVILKASPGSGKTTRVPPCLQDVVQGQIWVLEPRRLAARMSATRVAQELAEEPGQTVGWQMRFDRTFSEKTRILFLTEGMFAVRLAQDPDLRDVGCVVLDEFHERHQQTDVAFALCRRLQMNSRPDLRMIIMSATLDTSAINEKLLAAETITLDLPLFPVEIRHDYVDQNTALVDRVARASTDLANQTSQRGHILVFLPGTADIIRAKKQLLRNLDANEWVVLELRGSLD